MIICFLDAQGQACIYALFPLNVTNTIEVDGMFRSGTRFLSRRKLCLR